MGPVSLEEEEETPELSLSANTEEETCEDTGRRRAVCKPGRELSPETNPAGILIVNFQLPKREEINVCCLRYSDYGSLLQ